ncbi:hypothetical protein C8J57DRAFT_1728037 [Mycena rebaudengoi]|nr:hypothetical protein C8J57DRAFT_1728037 [Mycena rebaudengoi]
MSLLLPLAVRPPHISPKELEQSALSAVEILNPTLEKSAVDSVQRQPQFNDKKTKFRKVPKPHMPPNALGQSAPSDAEILNASLEKLITAVDSLQRQPQSADQKIKFWTAYKSLSDEFDKDFQRKYVTDLDTLLIFAGLFSAVSSAFIIQIQPELQPNQNAISQALLMILVQNITGIAVPNMPFLPQMEPAAAIVVAQSLLYFSLFSALLAGLLAVLGKQWLLHYDSVGERGTIEERGLERQRKLDGLRRWKFDLVMQIFPLLIQFALLLFASALSIYLWTIHHAIAAIVLGLTSFGIILYIVMVVSALASPDSPFQTSLTALLRVVIQIIPIPDRLQKLSLAPDLLRTTFNSLHQMFLRGCSSSLLPLFNIWKPATPSQSVPIFDQIPPPSAEVPAVIWTLETSTDPRLVEVAAAVVPDLQWPINLDLRPSLRRLSDVFNACFDDSRVREGLGNRATSCIKAFGWLEPVTARHEGSSDIWTFPSAYVQEAEPELQCMARFFRRSHFDRPFGSSTRAITPLTLHFISAQHPLEKHMHTVLHYFRVHEAPLDLKVLADFLFCINSFFAPPLAQDLSLMDKSAYCVPLTTLLFKHLGKRLADERPFHPELGAKIVRKLLQFKDQLGDRYKPGDDGQCRGAVYRFCAELGAAVSLVTSVLPLVRVDVQHLAPVHPGTNERTDPRWVYNALEDLYVSQRQNHDLIGDFIQILLHYGDIPGKPSATFLPILVSSISSGSSNRRTHDLILRLLCAAEHWFRDTELRPVLQEQYVWSRLQGALNTNDFIILVGKISQIREWQPVISQDLPTWLANLPTQLTLQEEDETRQAFCGVLSRVWNADALEGEQFGDERTLAMAFTVLSSNWDQLGFSGSEEIVRLAHLVECTVSAAFCARLHGPPGKCTLNNPSQRFKDQVIPRLANAVSRAAGRAKTVSSDASLQLAHGLGDIVNCSAEILSKLSVTINSELMNGRTPGDGATGDYADIRYWQGLHQAFKDDVEVLRDFEVAHQILRTISLAPTIIPSQSWEVTVPARRDVEWLLHLAAHSFRTVRATHELWTPPADVEDDRLAKKQEERESDPSPSHLGSKLPSGYPAGPATEPPGVLGGVKTSMQESLGLFDEGSVPNSDAFQQLDSIAPSDDTDTGVLKVRMTTLAAQPQESSWVSYREVHERLAQKKEEERESDASFLIGHENPGWVSYREVHERLARKKQEESELAKLPPMDPTVPATGSPGVLDGVEVSTQESPELFAEGFVGPTSDSSQQLEPVMDLQHLSSLSGGWLV